MSGPLVINRSSAVMSIRIDRPEAFNALNRDVLHDIGDAIGDVGRDHTIRAVVITGTGVKAFSAGADLHELDGLTVEQAHDLLSAGQHVMQVVESCPVPVIAAVNGLALGGGFELVLACTIPVLSSRASLGLPEAGLGLIPGYGGTQRLTRALGPAHAAFTMLSGERISAARAYELGLSPLPPVEPESLMDTAGSLAQMIASKGPKACRAILEATRLGSDIPLAERLEIETNLAAEALAGTESNEGVAAFREKRPAQFDGDEV